jgi:hypothetical protein
MFKKAFIFKFSLLPNLAKYSCKIITILATDQKIDPPPKKKKKPMDPNLITSAVQTQWWLMA